MYCFCFSLFVFRAAILTTSKSFCVKETVLSHELRLQYLQNASLFTDSYLSYSTEVEKIRRARLRSSTKKSTTDLFSTRSQKISVTKLLSRSVFNKKLGIPDRISSDDYWAYKRFQNWTSVKSRKWSNLKNCLHSTDFPVITMGKFF